MHIFGPHHLQKTHRIQPVDERPDDQEGDRRRRQVNYQGRAWSEKEEAELLIEQPAFPRSVREISAEEIHQTVYANPLHVERAHELLGKMTTLEEKVAQLCFYQTDATYNVVEKKEVELLVQAWQIGGLLFTHGEFKRQAYLVDHYQDLTKTELLIGNDFVHGISFYLKGQELENIDQVTQRFSDLGKAVMGLNRRTATHFQFDRERQGGKKYPITKSQVRAFRVGIRQAQGVVAQERQPQRVRGAAVDIKAHDVKLSAVADRENIQDFIGMKTLNFLDLTEERIYAEKLIKAFREPYDVLLFGANIQEGIRMIIRAVRLGKISEHEIERRILKLLTLKSSVIRTR